MAKRVPDRTPDLHYTVEVGTTDGTFCLAREGLAASEPVRMDTLLFLIEKDITVELQRRRPELLFLHSAALEWRGKAYLFAAESGSGKSTTAWGLLHHGFRYLSDELGPIDVDSLRVHPYPHALCLKQALVPGYPLPPSRLHLGRTVRVPSRLLPCADARRPSPIAALFIVRYDASRREPELRAMHPAEASARIYVTALNALSHRGSGLDPVIQLTEKLPCFALVSGDLKRTCDRVCGAAAQIIGS